METSNTRRVIALGFFDGVHLGHAALLRKVTQAAQAREAVPAALTFDHHPDDLVAGGRLALITSPEDRAGLMRRYYGIQDIITLHFDQTTMHMDWQEFVDRYLVAGHGAVHLVAGWDYRFGYKGLGDADKLARRCRELGVGCDIVPPVSVDGAVVSSTRIRGLLTSGELAAAIRCLGHPHVLTDRVEHGKRLGSRLGFPTVNLRFAPGVLIPAHGVYATRIWFENGTWRPAVTNIGVRPTMEDGRGVTVEGYILDFQGDVYGQTLRMEFCDYLRPERKFPSFQALTDEVMRNADQTRTYFQRQGF